MSVEPRRYLTHDMDKGRVELLVQACGNGDWYVSIVPEGHFGARIVSGDGRPGLRACVRVTTSGERREHIGAANAVADLYRAMGGEHAEKLRVESNRSDAEPLSEDQMAKTRNWPDDGWATPLLTQRLLATIRARDEEIARLRAELEDAQR